MNTNHLKGIKCPNCAAEGPFNIQYSTWVLTYDDGTDDGYDDIDYTEGSACICPNCNYEGPIHAFKVPVPCPQIPTQSPNTQSTFPPTNPPKKSSPSLPDPTAPGATSKSLGNTSN